MWLGSSSYCIFNSVVVKLKKKFHIVLEHDYYWLTLIFANIIFELINNITSIYIDARVSSDISLILNIYYTN